MLKINAYEKLYILACLVLAILCIIVACIFKIHVDYTDALITLSTLFILHAVKDKQND
jgi:hypothetical protein